MSTNSSVPHPSPFRYPGGKTWLIPYVRKWLREFGPPVNEFVEPFAGGASVGLTAVFEGLARTAIFVELDPHVAAVWQTILNGQGPWLARKIVTFKLSARSVQETFSANSTDPRDIAFATLLRNRVQRGGILAPDAGLMKRGENGRGLVSRWYPETLQKRILRIAACRDQIRFIHGDGIQFLNSYKPSGTVAFFVDPPYTVPGKRLYTHSHINHEALFRAVNRFKGRFVMTYDNTREIKLLANKFGFRTRLIQMKSAHNQIKHELLITA